MRFVLRIEFADDLARSDIKRILSSRVAISDEARSGLVRLSKRLKPWVSRLISFNGRQFEREFLKGQKDYSLANRRGTRGVYCYFYLAPGLYEVNDCAERYFAHVGTDLAFQKITKVEAVRCLASEG